MRAPAVFQNLGFVGLRDVPEIRTARMLAGATRACLGIASGRESTTRPLSATHPNATSQWVLAALIRHARAPARASTPLSRTTASPISADHRVKPGDDDVHEKVCCWDVPDVQTIGMRFDVAVVRPDV